VDRSSRNRSLDLSKEAWRWLDELVVRRSCESIPRESGRGEIVGFAAYLRMRACGRRDSLAEEKLR
jgi:hypothetical protein